MAPKNEISSDYIYNGKPYYITIAPKNEKDNLYATLSMLEKFLNNAIKYGSDEFHLWRERYPKEPYQYHYHGWFLAKNAIQLNKTFFMLMTKKIYMIKINEVKGPKVDTTYISKEGNKVITYVRDPLLKRQVVNYINKELYMPDLKPIINNQVNSPLQGVGGQTHEDTGTGL